MTSVAEDEMAKTSKDLRDQVALATDLLAERRWTRAGEVSALKLSLQNCWSKHDCSEIS